MNYPNKSKKEYNKFTSYANRGMNLEELLNLSNEYYLETNRAVIYKKPTPITIVDASFDKCGRVITKAYFKTPSTLDYNGLYKGKYIDFDAKETQNKTSFPLHNIHEHQLLHMRRIIEHDGITFLIIYMNSLFYLLDGKDIINFIDNHNRKSIPYTYIEEKGHIIEQKIKPRLNYLDILDKIYF